jgi:hypothetical protein
MRLSGLVAVILALASLAVAEPQQAPPAGNAQQPETPTSAPAKTSTPVREPSQPAPTKADAPGPAETTNGPAVDEAKVTGSTFESAYFKFTYELPKGWKAMDDAARMESNRRALAEDTSRASTPLPVANPKRSAAAKKAAPKNPALGHVNAPSLARYSLMVASPTGIDSLENMTLPRINVWAHQRVVPLDGLSDHAQFLVSDRRIKVLVEPQEVTMGGRKFARVDVLSPSGEYHSQFVTIVGDYLVGFDFRSDSRNELNMLANSMQTIKFQ